MVEVEKDIIGSGARTCAPDRPKRFMKPFVNVNKLRVTEQNRVARAN